MNFPIQVLKTATDQHPTRSGIGFSRLLVILTLIGLAGCSTPGAREAEIAEQQAATAAAEQEQARLDRERAMVAEQARQERAEAQARIQAQREAEQARLQAEAEARAAAERREREAMERRERERLAAIAEAEQERRQRLQRIASLEQQIAQIQSETAADQQRTTLLEEAIVAAEELLEALAAEQAKYENTDEQGNTVEPLAKDLIAELEARKDTLVRQINN